jgi:hypothetical protein
MVVKRIIFVLVLMLFIFMPARPGEGMWIPLLTDSLKLEEMQQQGFTLGVEEIYSVNHASLKDAVVIFGGGCTGELISPDGLVITNHHCGYSRIQAHSTVEHNYLKNGFWAASRNEELPNPGLTVTFLVSMKDVTKQALEGVNDSLPEAERSRRVRDNENRIEKRAAEGNNYNVEVKSFFFGRAFYLFVYEIYKDVRLVGAPPESIGRFGGDTDNWIWPRHSGDFSLFRIYAGRDNLPAEYSPDNVPYKPRKYLKLSLDGVKEGDFTMILGYPGRTDEYLTSGALDLIAVRTLPAKVEMRTLRLNSLQKLMERSDELRLRFAAKYFNISNSWKKWKGVTLGVERSDATHAREAQELEFTGWAEKQSSPEPGYSNLMDRFRQTYDLYRPLFLANDLGSEFLSSVDIFSLANSCLSQYYPLVDSSGSYVASAIAKLKKTGSSFFRSGFLETDRQILPDLLRIYAAHTSVTYHPEVYRTIRDEYNNDYSAYTAHLFGTSLFTDSVRFKRLMKKSPKVIHRILWTDPLTALYRDFNHILLFKTYDRLDSLNLVLNRLYREYMGGLMAMDPHHTFYPDANFTMRLTFGKVEGYRAADAVEYGFTTTLDGVMEKEDQNIADYHVSPELKEAYQKHDFGNWSVSGKIPVCFIASNHTSGGNSGSPVLNAHGELIGVNFDRNWEGTVSDYVYDPAVCRNISLDIRYILFIIDKVAHASWLLDEMTLVHHP